MTVPVLRFKWLDDADRDLPVPRFETAGAAGADVAANFPAENRDGLHVAPGDRVLIPTGLSMAIPEGYEVQIRPRSGLALKHGITLLNTPGTIDSDYRGPLGIILINLGRETFHVAHGMRIAQMVFASVIQPRLELVEILDETLRGSGGFGSTGL